MGASNWTKENADFAVLYVFFYVCGAPEFIGADLERYKIRRFQTGNQ